VDIRVTGVGPFINRIQKFDQDVYKVLRTEVTEAADLIASDAKNATPDQPLSRWGSWKVATGRSGTVGVVTMMQGSRDLSFDGSTVRTSIKSRAKLSRQRGKGITGIVGQVRIMNAAGAIFSRVGARSSSLFAQSIIKRFGSEYPRLLYPAWKRRGPEAGDKIARAIDAAAAKVP
jgi:hypothetical protein